MLSFYLSMLETGEEKSFIEKIYNEYEQTMYRIALGILHNNHDAEDAVYESFIRIINNISKMLNLSADKIGYYIVIIVKNVSFDMLTAMKKIPTVDIEEVYDIDSDFSVEDIIISELSYEKIKSALSELSETDYQILYLNLMMGYKPCEIAEILDINGHIMSQRLYKAKQRLKHKLEDMDYEQQ